MLKNLLLLLGYMAGVVCVQAQDSLPGPSLSPSSTGNVTGMYDETVDNQSRLYNGSEHYGYSYKIKGFAYFQDPGVQKGRIVYDELEYTDVPMWYDLVKDEVIIRHFNKYTRVALVSQKVKEFTILDHHFIRLVIDSLSGTPLTTGFYEQLYNDKTQVLARHIKVINEVVKDEVERDFSGHDWYYIKKGNSYYSVKNYKGLLGVFKEQSKEIKQYLRKNSIRYKNDPANTIVKAAAYYDSLNL
jgi:hypothetical protein